MFRSIVSRPGTNPLLDGPRVDIHLATLFFVLGGGVSVLSGAFGPSPFGLQLILMGGISIGGGAVIHLLPWEAWPRAARVVIPAAAFGIVHTSGLLGAQGPGTYGIFVLLVLLWVGFALPWGYVLPFAAGGGVSYALLYPEGAGPSGAIVEAGAIGAVSLVVALSMAATVGRLRLSELRLREAQDVATLGSWEWDASSNSVHAGAKCLQRFGIDPDTFGPPYGRYLERVDPEDRERLISAARRSLETGEPFRVDLRLVGPDGSVRVVECRGRVRYGGSASPRLMFGTAQDVTELREAAAQREELQIQHELRRSEERYRRFFEEDLTGDFVTTLDGEIVECNAALADFLGFASAADLRGENVTQFYRERVDREAFLRDLREKRKIERHERQFTRRDGKVVTAIVNSLGEFDDRGELVGLRGYLFDITDRKLLEEQLRQAQKMEAVGRLSGGIAHDFNNVLAAIRGNVELVLMDLPRESGSRGDLLEIRRSVERASALTGKLLAFSRRQVLRPRLIDLCRAVEDSAGMLRRMIGADIDVQMSCEDSCPVRVDPVQVEQILMNLATNARDAMPNGGRLIFEVSRDELTPADIRSYPYTVRPGRYACLTVSDTGHGMTPEVLENIFEPFFTTKSEERGTGLGLATVFGAVKQSGGYIWVDSSPGEGTDFHLYFPLIPDGAIEEDPRESSGDLADDERTEAVVLLAEDEAPVRRFVRRALERHGMRVLPAADAAEAIEVFHGHPGRVDLLLTDVVMPGMGGRELSDRLREVDPDLPVVFMSGYTEDEVIRQGVELSGQRFLQKPFSYEALLETVKAAIAR